jgi:hypothetical protein
MPRRRKKPQPKRQPPLYERLTVKQLFISAVALAGSIGVLAAGWEKVDPAVPVWRGYLREYTSSELRPLKVSDQETKGILRDLQIEQAEKGIGEAKNAAANWQLQQTLPQNKAPEQRQLIQKQMIELDNTKDRLDQQLRVLRDLKSQGK